MITELFEFLTNALEGAPFFALSAACVWGILSILLSPCHLASIPLIVGFINGQEKVSTKRAFLLSSLFSIGILITIALIGVLTAIMGRMLGDLGVWGNYAVALIFFVIGFHLLGLYSLPFMGGVNQSGIKSRGVWGALLLGLIFGVALGPCTFAYMAPILAVTFSVSTSKLMYGVLLLLFYGLGHCGVIVIAGTCMEAVERYLKWQHNSKGSLIVKRVCGLLVLFGGIYMIVVA